MDGGDRMATHIDMVVMRTSAMVRKFNRTYNCMRRQNMDEDDRAPCQAAFDWMVNSVYTECVKHGNGDPICKKYANDITLSHFPDAIISRQT